MCTDPNMGGVEKLSVAGMHPDLAATSTHNISSEQVAVEHKNLVNPFSVFMVKGWSRSFSALSVLACCWESADFMAAWPSTIKRTEVCGSAWNHGTGAFRPCMAL